MTIDHIPEVTSEEVVARKHKHNVHDKVQDQEQTFRSWWNGAQTNWILAVLAESRRKQQAFPDPKTHTARLCSVLTRAMASSSQKLCATIDQADDHDETPETIHSPAVMH